MGVFTVRPAIRLALLSAWKQAHESSLQRVGPPSGASWKGRRLGQAQRCSKEWNPPGVWSGPGGVWVGARASIHAKYARPSNEGIVGASRSQSMGRGPDESGAARAEQPLVAPGGEDVHAELDRRGIFGAEAVYSVGAQEDPFVGAAPSVRLRHRFGDLAERKLHAGRGVHPGERQAAGRG